MPKPANKPRPKHEDANQRAYRTMLESTGTEPSPVSPSMVSQVMSELGRRGGRIGGVARAKSLTPKKRSEIAMKAARARWGKPNA